MSGLFKNIRTSVTKENEGIPVYLEHAPNDDGTIPMFVLSRMSKSNVAYSKALAAATLPYRRQMELGTMKSEVAEKVFKDVFADTIVKGWQNVQDEKGQPTPFSKKAARVLLDTEGLNDLYEYLQAEANSAANYREAQLETESGN